MTQQQHNTAAGVESLQSGRLEQEEENLSEEWQEEIEALQAVYEDMVDNCGPGSLRFTTPLPQVFQASKACSVLQCTAEFHNQAFQTATCCDSASGVQR